MPAATPPGLTAVIGFSLPPSRLPEGDTEDSYLAYVPGRSKPKEEIRVNVVDLRDELADDDAARSPERVLGQLKDRGFAVMRHQSRWVDQIPTEEGTKGYLRETEKLLTNILGCTRTIAWNSVCRKNSEDTKEKAVTKQQKPEEGFIPSSRLQPIAGVAHVDQNAEWGFELCGKAAGTPAENFKRVQIINLWRPLHGPVTNAPLAMADYRTLSPSAMGTHASQFGFGLDIHHDPSQVWGYIRHQMPDEVVWLKCYDSEQGKGGEALYCGHAGVKVDDDWQGIEPDLVRPRESIEVRLVAIWD